ncbi:hypothetical protein Pcinc_007117 [Petrolisthes cinctipes]|uniref:Uncharacterized protein n=1 Tax=Petrolisthes cinctipes TaxID=88211 RepID=A0AAE1GBH5_PETCI|nr:hypothetical protein Pcinc_015653 [Petrolisthes cinctipes]KAK3888851.1 hypothetical protein Pcinc_007117 [Petrolisthes cinctipes]
MVPTAADVIIVDVPHLFYHPDGTEKIIVFDKCQNVSAKDHERLQRSSDFIIEYDLSITSPLPKRDAILKSKKNKQRSGRIHYTFNVDEAVTMYTKDYYGFLHVEADITMISYVLEAAYSGKSVIRVLNDGSDVFVLLVN